MELLKDFRIKDIIISEDFKNTQPGSRKMERAEQNYLQIGELPANIVINDQNVLVDGYITYLLAVKHGVHQMDVYRGYIEVVEAVHRPGSKSKYTWRVPFGLVGQIEEGDHVIVATSRGAKRVKVENVIRQQYPDQTVGRRSIFKKCGKGQ